MVKKFITLLILLFSLVACWGGGPDSRRATPTPGPDGAAPQTLGPVASPIVERLSVEVEAGLTPNVYVDIRGVLADRCYTARPDLAEFSQSERQITVNLPATLAQPCAPSPEKLDARLLVPLAEPAPGVYRLLVNGVAVTFELDESDFR